MNPFHDDGQATIYHGDALECLRQMPAESVDSVVSDPPYAEVDRPYGRLSVPEWEALMHATVRECRRVLKPKGSAVFIIQPNSEKIGKLRPWVFDFVSWCCREWNVVQDAYWWNHAAVPQAGCERVKGLMRPSVKHMVWVGDPDCYRNQDAVVWLESDSNKAQRLAYRAGEDLSGLQPSGHSRDRGKMAGAAARRVDPSGCTKNMASITRGRDYRPSGQGFNQQTAVSAFGDLGAVTPFNLLPLSNTESGASGGAYGHGAGTPLDLCRWWVRYLTPRGGTVLDPFVGTGTVLLAARAEGCFGIGIEKDRHSCEAAVERLKNGLTPPGKARGQAQLEFAP